MYSCIHKLMLIIWWTPVNAWKSLCCNKDISETLINATSKLDFDLCYFFRWKLPVRWQNECRSISCWNYMHLLFSCISVTSLWWSEKTTCFDNIFHICCMVFFLSDCICITSGCFFSEYSCLFAPAPLEGLIWLKSC